MTKTTKVSVTINGKQIKSLDDIAAMVEDANKSVKGRHETAAKKTGKPYEGATEELHGAVTKGFLFHPWHAFCIGVALGSRGISFD